jgi:hypothetical protein
VKVRFLADADLNKAIVSGVLRHEPSVDFLTAHAAGLRSMTDPKVLALAVGQQRVLVSHDVGTMPLYFREFRSTGKHSAGVFLVPQNLDIGVAIEELLLIWMASEAARSGKTGWSGCHSDAHPVRPPPRPLANFNGNRHNTPSVGNIA